MYIVTGLDRDKDHKLVRSLAITNADATYMLLIQFHFLLTGKHWTSHLVPLDTFPLPFTHYHDFLGFFKFGRILGENWESNIRRACDQAESSATGKHTWCYHVLVDLWNPDKIKRVFWPARDVGYSVSLILARIAEISHKRYHWESYHPSVPQSRALLSRKHLVDLDCEEANLPMP